MGKYDGLIRHADEAGDAVRKVIRAYHGSPYDFDRFDASKIGTGEGTATAGHGLYFGESERLARRYKEGSGRLYKVEIAHPQGAFIDFELPLSQQPTIASAIDRAAAAMSRRDAKMFAKFLAQDPDGHGAYMLMDHMLGPAPAAVAMVRNGVPGTRFLDNTGEGTRNYVIFPGAEDSIRILRKFAIPGAVGTGVASQYEGDR